MKDTTIQMGNTLEISPDYTYYHVALEILEKLLEFGVTPDKFSIGNTGFAFSYVLSGRPGLNYDELEIIRNITNPARDRKHPVSQMTMFNMTDLFIHPDVK